MHTFWFAKLCSPSHRPQAIEETVPFEGILTWLSYRQLLILEEKAMAKPLEGIRRFLDASRPTGPFCSMILGDLGAEVIKIEIPGAGDDTRHWGPPFINGESAYFLSINRNKKSVTLNLKNRRWKEDLLRAFG